MNKHPKIGSAPAFNSAIVPSMLLEQPKPNFWSRPFVGPVKNWHLVAIGLGSIALSLAVGFWPAGDKLDLALKELE